MRLSRKTTCFNWLTNKSDETPAEREHLARESNVRSQRHSCAVSASYTRWSAFNSYSLSLYRAQLHRLLSFSSLSRSRSLSFAHLTPHLRYCSSLSLSTIRLRLFIVCDTVYFYRLCVLFVCRFMFSTARTFSKLLPSTEVATFSLSVQFIHRYSVDN